MANPAAGPYLADHLAHPSGGALASREPLDVLRTVDPAPPGPGGSASRADFPREATVHGLISAQAARTPSRPALLSETGHGLTYRELEERSNRLAHALRDLPGRLDPDTPIGLCVERSPRMVVGVLAILKAGAPYLPLDPPLPPPRVYARS